MAFFDEKIDELSKRNPPQSVQDCLRTDGVSQTLWEWAKSIENWGRVVLILLIIGGCIIAVLTGMQVGRETLGDDTLPVLGTVFFTALQWGLYALIEYCVYHAVSLLMCSLASIVQSNRITSDLAVYNAGLIQESMGISEQSVGKHFSVEDLGELAKKKAQGLISDTEYETQRNEILKHL